MSRRTNPATIGAFVLGALALAVAGVATLASDTFFREQPKFVSYFDESVNGLDIGAPVKFKGVPIGQVTDIRVRVNLEEETFQVPVVYQVDMRQLQNAVGAPVDLTDPAVHREQVREGLRAQLQMESFVTGKLYVEINFVPQPKPVDLPDRRLSYLEIPTILSPTARIGEEASSLVSNLRRFDVTTINQNLINLLATANQKVERLNVRAINDSVLTAIGSARRLTDSPEVRRTLAELPSLARRLDSTLASTRTTIQRVNAAMGPEGEDVRATTEEVRVTMRELRKTMRWTRQTLSKESEMGYRLSEALAALSEAAKALRVLAVSLERNPSELIRGREQTEDN